MARTRIVVTPEMVEAGFKQFQEREKEITDSFFTDAFADAARAHGWTDEQVAEFRNIARKPKR